MSLRIELGTAIRDAGQASLQRDISPLEGNRRRSKPATPISPFRLSPPAKAGAGHDAVGFLLVTPQGATV